jgi:hypothetical protein
MYQCDLIKSSRAPDKYIDFDTEDYRVTYQLLNREHAILGADYESKFAFSPST